MQVLDSLALKSLGTLCQRIHSHANHSVMCIPYQMKRAKRTAVREGWMAPKAVHNSGWGREGVVCSSEGLHSKEE